MPPCDMASTADVRRPAARVAAAPAATSAEGPSADLGPQVVLKRAAIRFMARSTLRSSPAALRLEAEGDRVGDLALPDLRPAVLVEEARVDQERPGALRRMRSSSPTGVAASTTTARSRSTGWAAGTGARADISGTSASSCGRLMTAITGRPGRSHAAATRGCTSPSVAIGVAVGIDDAVPRARDADARAAPRLSRPGMRVAGAPTAACSASTSPSGRPRRHRPASPRPGCRAAPRPEQCDADVPRLERPVPAVSAWRARGCRSLQ